jgi:type I site-specific restriction endonuclease
LSLPAWFRPLPFRYQSTGIETCFTSGLDPDPRSFFEQMKGRGVRVINDTDLLAVTPDAVAKTHFVIVDAVGVCEQDKTDSRPLEKKPTVSLEKLLQAVALGNTESEVVSSIAGRFARLERKLDAVGKATSSAGGWSGYATMSLPAWRSGVMISSLHRSRRTAGLARCISCLERSCGGCWRS